jgi:hypothetical protein
MSRKILATAIVSIALAFSALPPAAAMSPDYAGRYFLNSVCPGRAKAQALNSAVFHGKNNFTGKQMHGKRLRQARRALAAFKRAEYNGARWLQSPPSAWPSDNATTAVDRVARALAKEVIVVANLRQTKGKQFKRFWLNRFIPANQAFASASKSARASLALPTGPRQGC